MIHTIIYRFYNTFYWLVFQGLKFSYIFSYQKKPSLLISGETEFLKRLNNNNNNNNNNITLLGTSHILRKALSNK